MAKQLIPEELDALIQQYLTDGILTDKERQVILRKAEGMGLDRDEIDLYLDAEVQKIDLANDAVARKQKGKTCPYCGGGVPQLTDKCPHCGEHITPEASEELQEILENLEEALVGLKSGKSIAENKAIVERYSRKAEMYYSNNPKIKKLLEQLQTEVVEAEKRGKTAARNAAISNAASSTAKGLGATIKYIALEHKTLTAGIIAAIVIFFLYFGYKAKVDADPTTNSKACVEAINDALKAGDPEKAESYLSGFKEVDEESAHAFYEIKEVAVPAIAKAYFEKGEYEKALSIDDMMNGLNYASQASEMRYAVQDIYIEAGNYDKAEKLINYHGDTSRYYDFLCKCIDHMQNNGKDDKIKSFISRKVPSHYTSSLSNDKDWQADAVKARLFEYAGVVFQ